jgi:hypothetical protein
VRPESYRSPAPLSTELREDASPQQSRLCAPASTGGDDPDSFQTNTHTPEQAPEGREWKRGERCKNAEERAAKKTYFYARKLALQRARRAASPRIDYMPSPEVWRAIKNRRSDGVTLSAIVDELIQAGLERVR